MALQTKFLHVAKLFYWRNFVFHSSVKNGLYRTNFDETDPCLITLAAGPCVPNSADVG